MRWALNFLLLICASLMLARLLAKEESLKEGSPLLSESFLKSLSSIEIKGEESLRIERSNERLLLVPESSFTVTSPESWPVKTASLTNLLFSLKALTPRGFLPDRPEYGLTTKPEFELVLTGAQGAEKLIFGKEHPFSGRRYAAFRGETILVDEALLTPLIKGDFIERRIINFRSAKVVKISLRKGSEERLSLDRDAKGHWSSSEQLPISTEQVDGWLERLGKLEALERTTQSPTAEGFELELSPGGSLYFEAPNDKFTPVFVEERRVGYLLDKRAFRLLAPRIEAFFNRKIFAGSTNLLLRDVEVLTVERIPGRIFPARPPSCSLKEGEERLLVFRGEGDERSYVADIGKLHLQGLLTLEQAEQFCRRAAR